MLFNESFSATNEREGSEIAHQVFHALVDSGVRVLAVTHLYELAERFHTKGADYALFLRATRETAQGRSFKLVEGAPLPTSFAEDVYNRLGGW